MKKMISFVTVMLVLLFVLTGCAEKETRNEVSNKATSKNNTMQNSSREDSKVKVVDYVEAAEKQMAKPEAGETVAVIHIKNYGDVKVKFFEEVAPKAVENFITHAKEGYYNGVTFHRVINEFMIQGGDPEGTGMGGESIWGEEFAEELDESIKPYRGSLCMASRGTQNSPSLGSQFFITQANYNENMLATLKKCGATDSLIEAYKKYGGELYWLYYYDRYTVFGQVYEGMEVVDKIAAVEVDAETKQPLEDVVIESIDVIVIE